MPSPVETSMLMSVANRNKLKSYFISLRCANTNLTCDFSKNSMLLLDGASQRTERNNNIGDLSACRAAVHITDHQISIVVFH